MKKSIFVAILFAMAAFSPAPIIDRRSNVKLEPEKSESVRATEQKALRMTEVGATPKVEGAVDAPPIEDEYSSAEAVRAGSRPAATDAVKKASADMEAQKSGGSPLRWLWGILVIGAVVGLMQVFKSWANKNLPDMPEINQSPK